MPARQKAEVTGAPEVQPQVSGTQERNFSQEDLEIKQELESQKKVGVFIAQLPANSSDDPMPDVTVSINGYNYQIQRGVEVEVPESVAQVLQNSMDAYYEDEKGRRHQARPDLQVMFRR